MSEVQFVLATVAAFMAFLTFISTSHIIYGNIIGNRIRALVGERTRLWVTDYWASLEITGRSLFSSELDRLGRWFARYQEYQANTVMSFLVLSVFLTRLSLLPANVLYAISASVRMHAGFPDWTYVALRILFCIGDLLLIFVAVRRRSLRGKAIALCYATILVNYGGALAFTIKSALAGEGLEPLKYAVFWVLLVVLSVIAVRCVRKFILPRVTTTSHAIWLLIGFLLATDLIGRLFGVELLDLIDFLVGNLIFMMVYAANYIFDRRSLERTAIYVEEQSRTQVPSSMKLGVLFGVLFLYAAAVFLVCNLRENIYSWIGWNLPPRKSFGSILGFDLYLWYLPTAMTTLLPIVSVFALLGVRATSSFLVRRVSTSSKWWFGEAKEHGKDPVYLTYMNVMLAMSVLASFVTWAVAYGAIGRLVKG